ncbi:hypothetical protein [Paenibacillus radicis (ex Xue et al. 2023)]|uniref:Uncharacterized protein n=1 Tax=Paenibacillus radicis (ex Xue et al. 2023) TaxID=2972489 RepID=A0ABT1YFM8_9BACL|nr:hypothetical protein [Paenibacillus radicis (ex Xue et al. 2023)]MCR8631737.1 hypothetical protein [Paenibacillus radicis (ex Xue et al. 2023)]
MPFVLKHKESNQLFTCTLVNGYKLAYYGTKYWDYEDDAAEGQQPFLESQSIEDSKLWELLELTENQLKMCNVKLKNDPRLSLYWDEANRSIRVDASQSES